MRSTLVSRLFLLTAAVAMLVASAPAQAEGHRFGVGLHYWRALDDLAEDGFDVDESGLAGIVSWQYGAFIRFEADLEIFPEGFGGSTDTAISPLVFVVVGSDLYAALGAGVTWSQDLEGDFSDPFWVARVGWDWDLLPKISLDLNLNYRFDAFSELDDVQSDAITAGAIVRFSF
ncbi:MAG: porin family protein [Thermoanaerobaculia bacterium]|nr:porin family protein [Thermoanaerobaculia bacterium]